MGAQTVVGVFQGEVWVVPEGKAAAIHWTAQRTVTEVQH